MESVPLQILTLPADRAIRRRHVGSISESKTRRRFSRSIRRGADRRHRSRWCWVIVAGKTSGTIAGRWWLHAQDAARVASVARRLAGVGPDVRAAIAAVMQSAGSIGAILTADDIAIARADGAMRRLDAIDAQNESLRRPSSIQSQIQSRPRGGCGRRKGFMSYGNAVPRLKLAR